MRPVRAKIGVVMLFLEAYENVCTTWTFPYSHLRVERLVLVRVSGESASPFDFGVYPGSAIGTFNQHASLQLSVFQPSAVHPAFAVSEVMTGPGRSRSGSTAT